MISSISPLLNLLAPKAIAPVASDPVAFDLMLAGAGEAVVGEATGRQIAVPTGKSMPPPADMLLPTTGSPIPSADEGAAEVPKPAPALPVALASNLLKPTITTRWPTATPRHAKPETCVGPTGEFPIAEDGPDEADKALPSLSVPVIEREGSTTTDPVAGPAERDRVAGPNSPQAPDPASPLPVPPPALGIETSSRATAPVRDVPIARLGNDGPRSSLPPVPSSAPAPAMMSQPIKKGSVPVASGSPMLVPIPPAVPGDRAVSDMIDGQMSPTPALAPRAGSPTPASGTTHAPSDRPIGASAPTHVSDYGFLRTPVVPAVPSAVVARSAVEIASSPSGPATVPPFGSSSARQSVDGASTPFAPPRFAGSSYRLPPEIASPAAQSVAPATPATPAMVVSANPVVGQVAFVPPTTEPVDKVETAVPFLEPRPDAGKPPAPDRLPVAPMPIAEGTLTATIARAVLSGPARQVFAADLRRTGRDLRPVAGEAPISLLDAAGVGATATAAPASAPLDLRQDRWPSQMMDRIERMRDAVDAVDTRIRLIPDALGSIDVAVKRDGDTVHVHFTAEQAATRALLQDAAPRLAEAAEARGLKLDQTAVGGDGAQPNGRQPQPQQPSAPTPARPRSAAAVDEDAADARIA